ncbi:hypothetical protein LG284_05470 [Citricoccus nitrophenolicus]
MGTDARRRYCSDACRMGAYRRRQPAFAERTEAARLRSRLDWVSAQLVEKETALGQSRGRVWERDREVAALRVQLADERRRRTKAIVGQANQAAGVREQLAAASGELSALRRNWSATAEARMATHEVTGLRDQLATIQDRHGQLAARYEELSEAAELAATERQQLQGVVRQWDTLCKRLYKATGGQPAAAADRDILATWTRFRQAVATPAGNRGRAPVTGQADGQVTGQSGTVGGVR